MLGRRPFISSVVAAATGAIAYAAVPSLVPGVNAATLIPGVFAGSMRYLRATSALMEIYEILGLAKSFSERVIYKEALGCRCNFEEHEHNWRVRGYRDFTKVERSTLDRDVAYLTAGDVDPRYRLHSAEAAVQYQDNLAVALLDDEPSVLLASAAVFNQNYRLSPAQRGQSLAVTSKSHVQARDGEIVTHIETPQTIVRHYPRPRKVARTGQTFNKGMVHLHVKNDNKNPDNGRYVGLYV